VLKSMGVTQPFAETADFSKLSSVATDPSTRYRSRSLANVCVPLSELAHTECPI
jgi:hypothetical protein